MAAYKVNISLPPALVAEIDATASAAGLTRSAFIAEASAHYIIERERTAASEQRKRDIDEATVDMRERGSKLPENVDYVALIRRFRERDGWDGTSE